MTDKTSQEKQYRRKIGRVFFVATLCLATSPLLASCAQMKAGDWLKKDKKPTKQVEAPAEPSRFSRFVSDWRTKLDRRPEAQKQRDEERRKRIYGAAASSGKKPASKKSASQAAKPVGSGLVTIEKGETYYSLARRYNVPMRALLAANKARPPYVLAPGDRVRLPQQQFYAVRKKDTLYSISRAHKTDVATLAKLNGLEKPFTISAGQRLQIPGLSPRLSKAAPQTSAPARTAKKAKPIAPQAPKRVGRFRVPVQGAVISGFGPKEGGLHNDGINIAARTGAPILAAENGVVVYTGNELRGYGNLLLVRHSGGWVTAYAHISKFRVKPGTRVKQGEVIAEVGQTGNVERPQLHFELRKGTRAVNPQSLI